MSNATSGAQSTTHGFSCPIRRRMAAGIFSALLVTTLHYGPNVVHASDHADPMDLTRLQPLEPVITDLFVFPVDAQGHPVSPFERTDQVRLHNPDLSLRPALPDAERDKIRGLIVILCVRRALTSQGTLQLEPYRYAIHMDTHGVPKYSDAAPAASAPDAAAGSGYRAAGPQRRKLSVEEARARYGGLIEHPETIDDDVLLELTLTNDAKLKQLQVVRGLAGYREGDYLDGSFDPERVSVWTGVRDDPFIFPAFFGTDVVAMVVYLPLRYFEAGERDWMIWATSHKGRRQIDHVGRSLRTQNPRFEFLNTLHPREHARAIQEEHDHPSLMRDFAVQLNVQSLFAFREWDFVPDVMIYSSRFQVGFPNGRLLTDDVAALLAQHGDTLLYELSHHNAQWPRRTINDKPFEADFPYLAEPWEGEPRREDLTWRSRWIRRLIGVGAWLFQGRSFVVQLLIVVVLVALFYLTLRLLEFLVRYWWRRWLGVPPRPKSTYL